MFLAHVTTGSNTLWLRRHTNIHTENCAYCAKHLGVSDFGGAGHSTGDLRRVPTERQKSLTTRHYSSKTSGSSNNLAERSEQVYSIFMS
jgi:hypothetical protein